VNRRTRLLNRGLDVLAAPPVVDAVHRGLDRLARLRAAGLGRLSVTLEEAGLPSRVDLALVAAELSAATAAVEHLTATVERLERALARDANGA
jgi:ubiquinone biosynthesis protein UbiJ